MRDQDWHAVARQWVESAAADEDQCLADLQRVVHRLWCARLRDELSTLIAQGATDREQLQAVAALNDRIRFHLQAERDLASSPDSH